MSRPETGQCEADDDECCCDNHRGPALDNEKGRAENDKQPKLYRRAGAVDDTVSKNVKIGQHRDLAR